MKKLFEKNERVWALLLVCWLLATVSTLGSLFFSEVMKFPPCVLCWYQRTCMYPLVLIFAAGLFPFDKKVLKYSFPLAFTGWTVAVYHNLLYYKIIPESAAPCVQGISCTTTFIQWFGFVTIPFLSLLSFTIILACLAVIYKETRK